MKISLNEKRLRHNAEERLRRAVERGTPSKHIEPPKHVADPRLVAGAVYYPGSRWFTPSGKHIIKVFPLLIAVLLLVGCMQLPTMKYCHQVRFSRDVEDVAIELRCKVPRDVSLPGLL